MPQLPRGGEGTGSVRWSAVVLDPLARLPWDRWCWWSGELSETPISRVLRISGPGRANGYQMGSDISHRAELARQLQASETELRETRERMELAANAAELGMWMWDIVRDEVWITDKGRAILGFEPSEKIDFNRFRSRLHPEDRESVVKAVEKSLGAGAE